VKTIFKILLFFVCSGLYGQQFIEADVIISRDSVSTPVLNADSANLDKIVSGELRNDTAYLDVVTSLISKIKLYDTVLVSFGGDSLMFYFDTDTVNLESNLNFYKLLNGAIRVDSINVNGIWYKSFASVAGNDKEIQFNNSGILGASPNFRWDDTLLIDGDIFLKGVLNINQDSGYIYHIFDDGVYLRNGITNNSVYLGDAGIGLSVIAADNEINMDAQTYIRLKTSSNWIDVDDSTLTASGQHVVIDDNLVVNNKLYGDTIIIGDSIVTEMYQGVIPDTTEVKRMIGEADYILAAGNNTDIQINKNGILGNANDQLTGSIFQFNGEKFYLEEPNQSNFFDVNLQQNNAYIDFTGYDNFSKRTSNFNLGDEYEMSIYKNGINGNDNFFYINAYIDTTLLSYIEKGLEISKSNDSSITYVSQHWTPENGIVLDLFTAKNSSGSIVGANYMRFNDNGIIIGHNSTYAGGNSEWSDTTLIIDSTFQNNDTSNYKVIIDEDKILHKSVNVYAGMYLDSNMVVTTIASQNVWYKIGNFIISSVFENASYTQDTIWIDYDGIYRIDFNASAYNATTAENYEIGISINGEEPLKESRKIQYFNPADKNQVTINYNTRLYSGDYIIAKVRDIEDTRNITFIYGIFSITKIN
jgi:hypothetical protein